MKKFIVSKFVGLQSYSRQLYYQMNSFTDIFDNIVRAPPHVLNTCGKPCDLDLILQYAKNVIETAHTSTVLSSSIPADAIDNSLIISSGTMNVKLPL